LIFENGIKGRELCPCDRKAKRRRLTHKQPDEVGAFKLCEVSSASAVHKRDAKGHALFIYAREGLTWCNVCGAFSSTHIKDLGRICEGAPGLGKVVGLRRLRAGCHLATAMQLSGKAERVLDG